MRFSDSMLSSSNLPTFKLAQVDWNRLSNRTNAVSIPTPAPSSTVGTNPNVMFLYRVPSISRSAPEISKPAWVTVRSAVPLVPSPGTASTGWFVVRSYRQLGVVRIASGKYEGLDQMGESRSLPSWYPLSLNFWPNGLSSGQAVWQAEQGSPYFRAKAGMALLECMFSASEARSRLDEPAVSSALYRAIAAISARGSIGVPAGVPARAGTATAALSRPHHTNTLDRAPPYPPLRPTSQSNMSPPSSRSTRTSGGATSGVFCCRRDTQQRCGSHTDAAARAGGAEGTGRSVLRLFVVHGVAEIAAGGTESIFALVRILSRAVPTCIQRTTEASNGAVTPKTTRSGPSARGPTGARP